MARVLILSLVFPPDNVSTAHIMGDLALDLRAAGHDVSVITATPHYNRDAEADERQQLRRVGTFFLRSDFQGIPVLHAKVGKKGRSIPGRLVSWIGFHLLTTLAGLRQQRPDVILCVSPPPLTIALSAWVLALRHRARFIYNIQEMYPDLAISAGAIRNRAVIALLRALERLVYRKAAAVTVIGPGMKENLLAKGVPEPKVRVVPNFVDVGVMSPLSKDNAFSREHDVVDKFVVSYAGNMGAPQGLEAIIAAAELLRRDPRIVFMMMGDGARRDSLEAEVRRLALENLLFLPQQPYSLVPSIYASSDINLVSLAAGLGADAIPSKVYRIMACERPIVACADAASELATLIIEARCGAVVAPGDARALADLVARAADERDEWRQKGVRGRQYVLEHFTRESVTRRYSELVDAVAAAP